MANASEVEEAHEEPEETERSRIGRKIEEMEDERAKEREKGKIGIAVDGH